MIAEEWRKCRDFNPSRQQLRRWRAVESSDIGTDKRNSADAEVKHHLAGEAQMVPGGRIIAGPGEAVALASGVRGTSQNERPLIGAQLQKSFICGASVFETYDVMDFRMRRRTRGEAWLFDAMNSVQRHSASRPVEYRRFV